MANELVLRGFCDVGLCSDVELVSRLERLATADRGLSAKLLVHLAEMDARALYCEHGYSSMYEYCVSALRMSEAEAYFRITAARIGRQFPLVVERLAAGDLNLTSIKLLAPVLTADNCVQLVDRARGKTKEEVKALVAELKPKDDVPARMRKLPAARVRTANAKSVGPSQASLLVMSAAEEQSPAQQVEGGSSSAQELELEAPRSRGCTTPLRPGRFKLELTLGQEGHDKLSQLRELLRHQNPSGDLTLIVERAISELLEREMKRRFAQTSAPARRNRSERAVREHACQVEEPSRDEGCSDETPGRAKGGSRYIPREVLREVYACDEGQCTFVSTEGRRCSARGFLEVHHHETTHARGGEQTTENLRLTCRAHNALYAERDYGRAFMQSKAKRTNTTQQRILGT